MRKMNEINEQFEVYLEHSLDHIQASKVKEAMKYSLLQGGKRVRPNLLFMVLKSYGINIEIGYSSAAAIEMIHTYSLIHDDLPAMDDDDLRRGKPTCHKVYGEATAILAGDALLTYAFDLILEAKASEELKILMIRALSEYSGANGMILGQMLDLEAEGKQEQTKEELERIHIHKTAKLITLPLMIGAYLGNKKEDIEVWQEIGEYLGIIFQIQDDILDAVSTSDMLGKSLSDKENHKTTYVTIHGVEKSKEIMTMYYEKIMVLIHELYIHEEHSISYIKALFHRKK